MPIQGQIKLRPEKISTGRQLKKIDDVVIAILEKNDYIGFDRKITYRSYGVVCSMSYNEFIDRYQNIYFDEFSYTLKSEQFSIIIRKLPFCHVALCFEVDGNQSNLFDIAGLLARIDHHTVAWKETDLMSERDYHERSEKKNRGLTFVSAVIGAALGASITVIVTRILEKLATIN